MNLKQYIEDKARRFAARTAVVCGNIRLSYAELDRATNRFANALRGRGVRKGDRVAILLPNSAEFAVAYLGVIKTGAIAVPLDARYKIPEVELLFNHCQPRAMVAETETLEPLIAALPLLSSVGTIIEVGSRRRSGCLNYGDILERASAEPFDNEEVEFDDIAHIGYTSGPTSRPHGVMLAHSNLIIGAEIAARSFQETERDVMMLFALPMHHVFGLIVGFLAALVNGGKVVILPGLSLGTLMELTEKEKGTIFMGVPYIYVLMVRMAEQEGIRHDLSSLRLCFSGGSCLPESTAIRFRELYGLHIGQVWGLTEATGNVTCTQLDGTWKANSAGRVAPGWEMKIVDDDGRELPFNQVGEVMVKGIIMKGYYRNPEDTARAITDGWLHTGDMGRIDEEGDLFIMGLKKKMIIVKGQNIYPVDIEGVIKKHPMVADVAVIGIADELRGEIVGAAISLRKGATMSEEEVRRICRQQLINYKIPKRILFVERVPRMPGGEVNKEELLSLFARAPAPAPES